MDQLPAGRCKIAAPTPANDWARVQDSRGHSAAIAERIYPKCDKPFDWQTSPQTGLACLLATGSLLSWLRLRTSHEIECRSSKLKDRRLEG